MSYPDGGKILNLMLSFVSSETLSFSNLTVAKEKKLDLVTSYFGPVTPDMNFGVPRAPTPNKRNGNKKEGFITHLRQKPGDTGKE
jgi:hypothetical protein